MASTGKQCAVCGFRRVTVLHHRDFNRNNNDKDNQITLCPNCHATIHWLGYKLEWFPDGKWRLVRPKPGTPYERKRCTICLREFVNIPTINICQICKDEGRTEIPII